MIPAKFAPLLFSFCLSIIMSCVVSGVATLNAAGLADGFATLWLAAWYKSWIVASPTILVVAPLTGGWWPDSPAMSQTKRAA